MEESMNDAYRRLLVEHNKLKIAYEELEARYQRSMSGTAAEAVIPKPEEVPSPMAE